MTLETLELALKRLNSPDFIDRLIIDAVEIHKADLINLIKGQISVGVKGDGSRTLKYVDDGSSYNPNYYVAKVKRTPAKQMPYRNYENTGNFLREVDAIAKDTSIFISSDATFVGSNENINTVVEELEGNEFFGLTDENKPEFAKIWIPTFVKLMKNEIYK